MHKYIPFLISIVIILTTSGCSSLKPELPEAKAKIPEVWSLPQSVSTENVGEIAVAAVSLDEITDIHWRDFFVDPRLVVLIAQAFENNHDLRTAALNVDRARELYHIQRADQLPSVSGNGTVVRRGGSGQDDIEQYTVQLGLASFEIDCFGRLKSLNEAALNRYLATEEARKSIQLSLIAEVANAYTTLAATMELRALAQKTLELYKEELSLTRRRFELGAVSELDLNRSRTITASARAEIALYEGQVAQAVSALTLLVGAPIEKEFLPENMLSPDAGMVAIPSGIPSEILLRRPDIRQAELQLVAANANIAVARAAFFPSISLTSALGMSSGDLEHLISDDSEIWSLSPGITIPVFQGGRLKANREISYVDQEIALTQYEQAIQQGFREVSDALVLSWTLLDRRLALQEYVAAADDTRRLSEVRYKAGRDSYLSLIDAERTLYRARQALVQAQLSEQTNIINLYKVLGGSWSDQS